RRAALEILHGQPALAVRRVGQRDALVVDLDVGMMIGRLRFGDEAVDEGDGLRGILERVLLADGVALERPAGEALDALLPFCPRKLHGSAPDAWIGRRPA